MNLSVLDKDFSIMVVSQFTLYGNCKKVTGQVLLMQKHHKKLKNYMNYLLMN